LSDLILHACSLTNSPKRDGVSTTAHLRGLRFQPAARNQKPIVRPVTGQPRHTRTWCGRSPAQRDRAPAQVVQFAHDCTARLHSATKLSRVSSWCQLRVKHGSSEHVRCTSASPLNPDDLERRPNCPRRAKSGHLRSREAHRR